MGRKAIYLPNLPSLPAVFRITQGLMSKYLMFQQSSLNVYVGFLPFSYLL